MSSYTPYTVWDAPTRWFHWINLLCVLALAGSGLVILNAATLGMGSDGTVTLKTAHVFIGYAFVFNLGWRLAWAFMGNRYARWRALLPGGAGYWGALRAYVAAFIAGQPQHYLGHSPPGRIGVTVLLALLVVLAASGLVLAGTDLFHPPFGRWIAQWIAADGVDPMRLVPYAPQLYDAGAYQALRALRAPIVATHEVAFFALALVAVLHVIAVVVTELREGGSLVSAMFTGRKLLRGPPADGDNSGPA